MKVINFKKMYKSATIHVPLIDTEAKVVLFVGANGSGKTTLLKAFANLIRYEGELTLTPDSIYIQEQIDYPSAMTPRIYLEGILSIGKGERSRYEMLVNQLSMETHLDKPFKSCSKGMKQKINLIQGLMENREVYLLDEPLSGLDAESRQRVIDYLKASTSRFICSTHDESLFKGTRAKVVHL